MCFFFVFQLLGLENGVVMVVCTLFIHLLLSFVSQGGAHLDGR